MKLHGGTRNGGTRARRLLIGGAALLPVGAMSMLGAGALGVQGAGADVNPTAQTVNFESPSQLNFDDAGVPVAAVELTDCNTNGSVAATVGSGMWDTTAACVINGTFDNDQATITIPAGGASGTYDTSNDEVDHLQITSATVEFEGGPVAGCTLDIDPTSVPGQVIFDDFSGGVLTQSSPTAFSTTVGTDISVGGDACSSTGNFLVTTAIESGITLESTSSVTA